jgi:hypothetical protein
MMSAEQAIVGGVLSTTVTVAWQVDVLFAASFTVSVTVFGPLLAQVNALGLTVRDVIPQLSLLPLSTSAAVIEALPLASNTTVTFLQIAVGGVVSLTVKLVVQVALLFAASFTVIVIVVTPVVTSVPAAGLWVTVNEPDGVQLSLAATPAVTSGTGAWQAEFADAPVGAGQVEITGGVVSATVTVAVHVADPAEFSAVKVTVTLPGPTIVPAAGDWVTVTEQPVVVTSPTIFGMVPSQFAFTETVLFAAQAVIVGGAGATTVTVKPQVGPWLLVQVTWVVPEWNVEPDGGSHVTVPQLPVVDGPA